MKNILLITTDQQRKDSLGCYGNSVTATPNLDRLAGRGVRYERNYVANQICMPNRLSLMTGQNIRSHGLWTNGLLLDERCTLAHHLADQGYDTASIGKIHFTPFGGEAENRESIPWWYEHPEAVDWHGPYWGFKYVELALGHTSPVAHYGEWFYRNSVQLGRNTRL
ncbi:MAG: sulfatase-like hydrolase/transferase, partial [Candidatus Sumerlaeota bacterium]